MKKLITFAVLFAVVLVVIIVIFSGGETAAIYSKPHLNDGDYLKEVKKHEVDELTHYKLIDTVRQIYSIPIDSAIVKFVDENK
jgi:hypothetical protein